MSVLRNHKQLCLKLLEGLVLKERTEIGLWSQEPQESNQYFHSFSVIVESSRWCHLSHKHFNSHDPPTLIKSKPCCEPCGINQGKPGWEEFWEGKVSDKVVRSFWMKTPTPKQQFCFCYDRVGLKTTVNITWPDLTVFLAAEKQPILASDQRLAFCPAFCSSAMLLYLGRGVIVQSSSPSFHFFR